MQWHYIKKYMSQGVRTIYMESFILVSQSAQPSRYATLLNSQNTKETQQ